MYSFGSYLIKFFREFFIRKKANTNMHDPIYFEKILAMQISIYLNLINILFGQRVFMNLRVGNA
jgi:hypothetical protein